MTNVMKSRTLAERVVDLVGYDSILDKEHSTKDKIIQAVGGWLFPYYALGERDRAIYELQKKLRIKALDGSSVIRVTYDSPDPIRSQKIVQAFVDTYLVEHSQNYRTAGSYQFLASELDAARHRLENKESQLERFRGESGLIAPAEQRSALVGRISKLKSDLMDAQSQRGAWMLKWPHCRLRCRGCRRRRSHRN